MNYWRFHILLWCLVLVGITTTTAQPFKPKISENESNIESTQKMRIRAIKKGEGVIVTAPNYDNIGSVLAKIGFKFKPYGGNLTNAKMLFMNCGSSTDIPASQLRIFVRNGGILYASDLTHLTLIEAFGGKFNFAGANGVKGEMTATVVDSDLKSVLGSKMKIHFDLRNWAVLNSIPTEGNVLLEASGRPLMVVVPYGKGKIIYTCFHNHQQSSKKEVALMKLLLTKQVQLYAKMSSFSDTAKAMDINLEKMKMEIKK